MAEYQGSIEINYPTQVNGLSKAENKVKVKKVFITIGSAALIGGIIVGVGFAGEQNWLKITGYIVGGVILLGGLGMSLTAKVSNCVYCGHELGKTVDDTISKLDENEKIECGNCHEWLISHEGEVRAFTKEDAEKRKKTLDAPLFEDGGWQNECVVCGGEAMRVEEAKKTKMNAEQLLLGRVSVSSASIGNIPYCMEHSGEIELKIKEDYLRVIFPDLDMMKRYLAANAGKMGKRVKVENAIQKLVKKK